MREATAIEGQAQIDESEMNWIADYIVDDDRRAGHSQPLVHKLHHILGFQMMNKQAAAYKVKASIGEGQSNCIAGHGGCPMTSAVSEMRMSPIEESDFK